MIVFSHIFDNVDCAYSHPVSLKMPLMDFTDYPDTLIPLANCSSFIHIEKLYQSFEKGNPLEAIQLDGAFPDFSPPKDPRLYTEYVVMEQNGKWCFFNNRDVLAGCNTPEFTCQSFTTNAAFSFLQYFLSECGKYRFFHMTDSLKVWDGRHLWGIPAENLGMVVQTESYGNEILLHAIERQYKQIVYSHWVWHTRKGALVRIRESHPTHPLALQSEIPQTHKKLCDLGLLWVDNAPTRQRVREEYGVVNPPVIHIQEWAVYKNMKICHAVLEWRYQEYTYSIAVDRDWTPDENMASRFAGLKSYIFSD